MIKCRSTIGRIGVEFVASPEAVAVASFADKERAVANELGGEGPGVTRAPQCQAQLLLLPNGRNVQAEAPKEYVLSDGNPGLDNFLDGHGHPHVAVCHHLLRAPDT